jgi:hypothetical protein
MARRRASNRTLSVPSAAAAHELVAQGQDFDTLVPIAHRQQAQQGERVRHTQVRQSQQHGPPSCRADHQMREQP